MSLKRYETRISRMHRSASLRAHQSLALAGSTHQSSARACQSLVALDVDKRVSRAIKTPRPRPAARGGAISVNVAPNTALLVCGSDHNDEISSMLTPFLLRVPLPDAEPAAAASVS